MRYSSLPWIPRCSQPVIWEFIQSGRCFFARCKNRPCVWRKITNKSIKKMRGSITRTSSSPPCAEDEFWHQPSPLSKRQSQQQQMKGASLLPVLLCGPQTPSLFCFSCYAVALGQKHGCALSWWDAPVSWLLRGWRIRLWCEGICVEVSGAP